VAVSEEVRVNPDGSSQRVTVPVELPEGTSYEGFFGSADRSGANQAVGAPPPSAMPRGRRSPGSGIAPQPMPPTVGGGVRGDVDTTAESPAVRTIRVVSATGVDAQNWGQLTQYLQTALPPDLVGEFVLSLTIENGAVVGMVLDDAASSALTPEKLAQLRQALLRWTNVPATGRSIRLHFILR
jgi:Ca-activated chloride channel family protein